MSKSNYCGRKSSPRRRMLSRQHVHLRGKDFVQFTNGAYIVWPTWVSILVIVIAVVLILRACAASDG